MLLTDICFIPYIMRTSLSDLSAQEVTYIALQPYFDVYHQLLCNQSNL